jgi:hypothetical protein
MSVELVSKSDAVFTNVNLVANGVYWFVDLSRTGNEKSGITYAMHVRNYHAGGVNKEFAVCKELYDFLIWTLDNDISMFSAIVKNEVEND